MPCGGGDPIDEVADTRAGGGDIRSRAQAAGYCLDGLGQVDLLLGRPERATQRLAGAGATFERIGAQMQPFDRRLYEAAVADARKALGEDAFAVAWAAGRRLDLEQAVAEAASP